MNLTAVNFSNSTLNNISFQGTILSDAVFRNVISSSIKGIPRSLPIGTIIFNEQFFYTQDDVNLPQISLTTPIITTNTISPTIISDSNKNIIFSGVLLNNEQHLLVYLSQDYINPNSFEENTIHIVSTSNNALISSFQIPNFFIVSLTIQPFNYGKGGMLIGYGYQNSILSSLKYITIRLDPNSQLDTLYYDTGYKIQNINNNLYPSGVTEMILRQEDLHYLTQSHTNQMVISKIDIIYAMDCSGRDFSGKNISGLDLSGRNFTNCNFTQTNLSYCNLSNANFTNAIINGTNFSYSNLTNVILTGATIISPILTGISFKSQNTDFVLPNGFKFINNYLIGPRLNLDDMDLSGFNLSNVNLSGSSLRRTILTNTKVWGTTFLDCIFDKTITGGMIGTPILSNNYKLINGFIVGQYMNLQNANLSNIDLSNMNLNSTNLNNCDLSGTIFTNTTSGLIIGSPILSSDTTLINGYLIGKGVSVIKADLSGGDLTNIDISDAQLTDVNFYNVRSGNTKGTPVLSSVYTMRNGYLLGPYVNISTLDFSGVNLSNISLYDANVNDTDFRYSNLSGLSTGNLRGIPILPSDYKLLNGYIVGPNVNLRNANLSNTNLYGMNLDGTDLQNAIFTEVSSGGIAGTPLLSSNYRLMRGYIVGRQTKLIGANLEYQDFSDLDLYQTDFTDSKLNHAIFHRNSIFDTNFTNIEFLNIRSSDLLGIPSYLPQGLSIVEAYINNKSSRTFIGRSIKLENIEFRNQSLANIDLSFSDLINVYFNNTSIQSTNFNRTNLFGIRSRNVLGTPIDLPSQWTMINGYLIGPNANLMYSDFTNMNLSGLNLSDANLLSVRFDNTRAGPIIGQPILDFDWRVVELDYNNSLQPFIIGPGMDLSLMDLSGRNFTNFNLSNTNLDQTNLSNAILTNVKSGGIKGTPLVLPTSWRLVNGYLIGPTANLTDANLENQILSGLNIQNGILSNSKLNNTILTGSNLNGIKSGGIQGIPILPIGWKLINGYLIGPYADVTGADLTGADLTDIDLTGTNLTKTNLTNANLSNVIINNTIFLGANLTNITPQSIYSQIDLTGVILPDDNYFQYNYFVSKDIKMSDFVSIRYNELRQKVFQKIFSGQSVKKDIKLSFIKRLNLKLYNELFILYTESSNGSKNDSYFDNLTLEDIDIRFQIYQRTLSLINNMSYVDDFLLRLMNRFDIETIPEMILRNINFSLALPETVAIFYMKHLFNDKFHTMILSQSIIREKVEIFFRKSSKIYDDNLFVKNLYGVSNNTIQDSYLNLVKMYRYQVEIFENYLYSVDIVDQYTNASKIAFLFSKMVDLDLKYITPVVFDLFKRIVSNIFGPLTQRDNFDLYKLSENRLFISTDFEKHLISEFISKNQNIVQSIFNNIPTLGAFWTEIKKSKPDFYVLKGIYTWIDTLDTAMVYFRRQLFENIKYITYTYVYPSDITETVLTMRNNKLDSMMNMNDENLALVAEYLKDNQYVKRILQNPKQYIKDIQQSNFTEIKDITKLYGLSIYSTPEMKDKMIKYDILLKIKQDENRYVELFAGLKTDIKGDENLIAPLEEYRRVWNVIMS